MRTWARWVAVCGLALSATGPVWADEPSREGDKAELEVLKARIEKLEAKLAKREGEIVPPTGGEAPSMGQKPGAPTIELPSGLGSVQISGHVDTSYTYNFAHPDPSARTNRGRVFDTQAGGFDIQAAELVLEKPLSSESPIGFRTDLFFGDDAEVIHSTGLGTGGTPSDSFDLQQAYVTFRAPVGEGLDLKAGKFVTLLGSEVIESPANWNFSRSYLFGFSIPFTHTGALVSYPLGEWGSVTGGLVNGWDIVDDNNNAKSMIGSLALTPLKGVSFWANGITGAERAADNRNDRSVLDLVASWQPIESLTLMANYDYGHESSIARAAGTPGGVAGFDSANWTGLALYAKYDLTPKWSLAGRWEWFDDRDGVRTALSTKDGSVPNGIDFTEFTLTSQWTLHEHLLARLEYRHDQADERVFFQGGDGFQNGYDTIATEFICHF